MRNVRTLRKLLRIFKTDEKKIYYIVEHWKYSKKDPNMLLHFLIEMGIEPRHAALIVEHMFKK